MRLKGTKLKGSVTLKERNVALEKLELGINNDINELISISKNCSATELYYLIYLIKMSRILKMNSDTYPNVGPAYMNLLSSSWEEALKYSVQLVYKYGNKPSNGFNHAIATFMHKKAALLNSKFDSRSLIKLFDVDVSEDQQYLDLDTSLLYKDDDVKSFFDYFLRIELDNNLHKGNLHRLKDLILLFKKEFTPASKLFIHEFGVTIDVYIHFYEYVCNILIKRLTEFETKAPKLPNGQISSMQEETIYMFISHIMIDEKDIIKKMGQKVRPLIQRLILDPTEIIDDQLHFHQLARKPILRAVTGELIISPDLFLDSLITNTHYSLLQGSKTISDEYQAITANIFLTQIQVITRKFGYTRVHTNLELYEGKSQIGDLDLVLKDKSGHTLIIEAKRHALPMQVYFKDVEATHKRLNELKKKWESKVKRRMDHLKEKHIAYGIKEPYTYLIVSLNPEILSHYSDILCLTLNEFESYLSIEDKKDISFKEIVGITYNNKDWHLSQAELKQLRVDGMTIIT
ncbi:hypothetical protein [Paenibacillus illinoisensis]|uniref:Uncharacterized protein n=1 Tax=Paenibacillus illinoisensis TaxID=59845 RepID=A0A2W0CBP2_9BACL|nr:hypothetical protein [Paenibacillus illinoisensis]PYY27522.1 Uncharacterized protein PIL02S_04115 [Paenibacillus illinoisensis]